MQKLILTLMSYKKYWSEKYYRSYKDDVMSKLLEKAIAFVRSLPESEQDGIAAMILQGLEKTSRCLG